MRSILANPSLALHTREFKSTTFTEPSSYDVFSFLSQSQRTKLERTIYSACDRDDALAEKWTNDVFNNFDNYDAVTAIIFCLLPNLSSIQIDSYGWPGGNPYVQHVFKRAAKLQEDTASILSYRMESLSKVSLSWQNHEETELDFDEAICFIWPPSVQTFFCRGLNSDSGTMKLVKSRVREMTFDACPISELTMNHILQHCVALRRFKRTLCGPFNPFPFTVGLQPSRQTLEELILLGDGLYDFEPTDWSKFEKLERLEISWYALTEPLQVTEEDDAKGDENEMQGKHQKVTRKFLQRLPPSLKSLRMSSCPDKRNISPFVKALVMAKDIYTPYLEVVVLVSVLSERFVVGEEEPVEEKVRRQKLVDLCGSFGLSLIWDEDDLE